MNGLNADANPLLRSRPIQQNELNGAFASVDRIRRIENCLITNDCETAVYSHRVLQGKWEVDQFHLAIIIECTPTTVIVQPR